MIVLQQLSGQHRGRRVEFSDGPVLLGRSPDADLRFDPHADIDVSARHAVLERDGERWVLRDVGSRNGTFVGGRRIRERVLGDRDEIELGHGGPRLHVTLPAATAIEEADTEPGRSLFDSPSAPAPGGSEPIADEATRVVSHEAETVALSPEAETVVAPAEKRPSVSPELPTRQEIPRRRPTRRGQAEDEERARLEAKLRRARAGLVLTFALLLVAVAALFLNR